MKYEVTNALTHSTMYTNRMKCICSCQLYLRFGNSNPIRPLLSCSTSRFYRVYNKQFASSNSIFFVSRVIRLATAWNASQTILLRFNARRKWDCQAHLCPVYSIHLSVCLFVCVCIYILWNKGRSEYEKVSFSISLPPNRTLLHVTQSAQVHSPFESSTHTSAKWEENIEVTMLRWPKLLANSQIFSPIFKFLCLRHHYFHFSLYCFHTEKKLGEWVSLLWTL